MDAALYRASALSRSSVSCCMYRTRSAASRRDSSSDACAAVYGISEGLTKKGMLPVFVANSHLGGKELLLASVLGRRRLADERLRRGTAKRVTLGPEIYHAAPALNVSRAFL